MDSLYNLIFGFLVGVLYNGYLLDFKVKCRFDSVMDDLWDSNSHQTNLCLWLVVFIRKYSVLWKSYPLRSILNNYIVMFHYCCYIGLGYHMGILYRSWSRSRSLVRKFTISRRRMELFWFIFTYGLGQYFSLLWNELELKSFTKSQHRRLKNTAITGIFHSKAYSIVFWV